MSGRRRSPPAGGRRASPFPYRARDRHLSLSRGGSASGQRGVKPDHPSRRRQLDGGGARYHAFRANAPETRKGPHSGYGIQTWVALPEAHEDAEPRFEHHAKETLPVIESEGIRLRLVLGGAYGETAPPSVFSDTFYADVQLKPDARIPLPDDHEERGLYILEGSVSVAGQSFESVRMMVFRPKDRIGVAAGPQGARLMLLGGAPLGGPRHIWWNFVASSQEKIEAAKEQWRKGDWGHGLFDLPTGDRDEFIPLRP
jgi:Pirin C-terminal cupin domain